jgi:hypothetical protein
MQYTAIIVMVSGELTAGEQVTPAISGRSSKFQYQLCIESHLKLMARKKRRPFFLNTDENTV